MKNVFVSYAHRLDQDAADDFRAKFSLEKSVFSDSSLANQDLSHLSDDYIKRNYISPRIDRASVSIVLIGKETGGRWWVDWEIYHSLRTQIGKNQNGILGILIPNKVHWIPQRLLDNKHLCNIIDMPRDYRTLENEIEKAYQLSLKYNSDLSRILRQRNSFS
ncbi:TIR domain-containing protein [Runella limosa]|uniref:TIR domain-containing protein n=1 Tax=Runella limosa TaxID=370978 RepID=UPI00048EC1A1|nr:TIR domain-containing protein [Runella limosa]